MYFFPLKIILTEGPSLLENGEGVAMTDNGLMNTDQQGTGNVTLFRLGDTLGGFWQASISNLVQLFPVSTEENPTQNNLKT